jgi:hypothetical protein
MPELFGPLTLTVNPRTSTFHITVEDYRSLVSACNDPRMFQCACSSPSPGGEGRVRASSVPLCSMCSLWLSQVLKAFHHAKHSLVSPPVVNARAVSVAAANRGTDHCLR